jgi:hypothetical protein
MARAGGFMPLLRRTPTVLRLLHPSGGVPGGARGWSTDRARCLHRNIARDRSGRQLRPRSVWLAMRAVTSGPSPAPGTRPPSTPARSRSARGTAATCLGGQALVLPAQLFGHRACVGRGRSYPASNRTLANRMVVGSPVTVKAPAATCYAACPLLMPWTALH